MLSLKNILFPFIKSIVPSIFDFLWPLGTNFGIFGNPDLNPETTISYELGLRQEVASRTRLELKGFYRDARNYVSSGIPIDLGDGKNYYTFVNKDYSNSRGLILSFYRQFSNYVGWHMDYTYQVAEGSNSAPNEEFGAGLLELDMKEILESKLANIKKENKIVSNFEEYANFGKVISDDLEGYQGPLAGISKALKVCSTPYLLVLPCDSPLIDAALIDSLIEKMEVTKADICVAHDGSIMHATFALMQTKLEKNLEEFLEEGGRKMALWYRQQSLERIDVSSHLEVLTNINRPEDFNL